MNPDADLMKRSHEGEKAARDELVKKNMGLVYMVAGRFKNRGHEQEELVQIGAIGLIKAIDHFDISLNFAFSTYAVPMIAGEIRRFLRDDGMVRVSRSLKENAYKIKKAQEMLQEKLQREPGILELAEATGLQPQEIVQAVEANREIESIYKPVYSKDGEELLYVDKLCSENKEEEVLNRLLVAQMMERLPELERKVIKMRYFQNQTQKITAEELGMSQVQVSRLEKKILGRLREDLLHNRIDDKM